MNKKSFLIVIGAIILVALIGVGVYVSAYNNLVSKDENVNSKFSQIDNQLQRRNDLIPNLVETVKGYTKHEEQVFKDLADARSKLTNSTTVQDKANADAQITTALRGLNVIVENYPNLKANENYLKLQDELAGTENRIAVSRKDYNDSVKDFNSYKRKFFVNMFFGGKYQDKQYFKAAEGAEKVPSVKF
ncbi:LemA family protein [Clostridium fungisolvens]|uniref:Protein LemA n=1 Tax=Clostridium fungisolvens TaxID=1604897 RepID=A0A6V8SUD1_9CLOT|nr:LemA family protein [Clostridium fungisolvens]GFP78493.1 Protein LemA [Clostridium fungisolvens]